MKVILLLILLVAARSETWSSKSWKIFDSAMDTAWYTSEELQILVGYKSRVEFAENAVETLKSRLPKTIKGQDEALNQIFEATMAWEMDKHRNGPLLMIFAGETGVGKTETGFQMASSLMAPRLSSSTRNRVPGLLTLRGEDYSPQSVAGLLGIAEIKSRIVTTLAKHMDEVGNKFIVAFEEVQKVMPGTLDALKAALDGSFNYFDPKTASQKTYDTREVIFIFTTDFGVDEIREFVAHYGRASITAKQLKLLKKAILEDLQSRDGWKEDVSKFVKAVVPFLPLQQPQLQAICRTSLNRFAVLHRGTRWADLVVDESVVEALVSNAALYDTVYMDFNGPSGIQRVDFKSARTGGRILENGVDGPLARFKEKLASLLDGKWDPSRVLHIGLYTQELAQFWHSLSKVENKFYIQWCQLHDSMYPPGECLAGQQKETCSGPDKNIPHDAMQGYSQWLKVPPEIARSSTCTTVHVTTFDNE